MVGGRQVKYLSNDPQLNFSDSMNVRNEVLFLKHLRKFVDRRSNDYEIQQIVLKFRRQKTNFGEKNAYYTHFLLTHANNQ